MAAEFNPYHVWLGIPPEDQPANHYRLLSLRLFENDGDVIDSAADRQTAHLRTFQSGKHGNLTQRLLNEVAAARVCLLDPKKRAAYDQQLRAALAASNPPIATAQPAPGGSAIQRQPPRRPANAGEAPVAAQAPAQAAPQPADPWSDLLGDSSAKPARAPGAKSASSAKAGAAKQDAKNRMISIGIAAGIVLIAGVAFGIYSLSGSGAGSEGTLVFDWPDRADVAVKVDGAAIDVPASGAWERNFAAGAHHVTAQRPAFKLAADVNLDAGQRLSVPAEWKPKAVLVLSWPPGLRSGAVLKIDGRAQTISQHDPLEVPVEPGRHTIQITRPNFDPINTSAVVAADGREIVAIAAPPAEAKLVFDWPPADRKDADLIVDGNSHTIADGSDSEPFALKLEPGRHVVQITRRGFEPFNQAVDLSAGSDSQIKPTWTPEKKIAAAPPVADTTAPVEVAPTEPVKKLPVPAAAEQEKIAKQLNDLYKTSQPGPKDPAKAQELYDVAAKDGSSPNERYMLLMKGAEIGAMAGDLNLALQGIDTLDGDYDIDALEAKQKLLDKFIAAGKPDQVAIAIPTAEQLVDQAVAADRFDIAVVLATTASKAVAKSKIATHKEVEERLARRRHDIHLIEPIYAAAKKAQETLEKTPADPEANLTVGRWLCFYKGDWTTGLPILARGSDEKLKALAEQEIKSPTDADQQVKLADAWWDLAQKEAGIARDSLHLHAGNIYQEAMPNLASALKKAAIEKRLAEVADLKPLPTGAAAGNSSSSGNSTGPIRIALKKWVDVLRLVDPTRDSVSGNWTRKGAEISCDSSATRARIEIPVVIDGEYDLDVEFVRISGTNEVDTIIPVDSRQCRVVLSGRDGEASGLGRVDDRQPVDGDNPTAVRPGTVENGHRYQLHISVRLAQQGRASIEVSLDGKQYLPRWAGNQSSLDAGGEWSLRNSHRVGLGAGPVSVAYRSVRLRMVSGSASLDPAVDGSKASQTSRGVVGQISGTYRITSKHGGLCLGTVGEGKESGNAIGAWAQTAGEDRLWEIVPIAGGEFKIVNKKSGKCMGVENGRTEAGAFALEWDSLDVPDQRWFVEALGRGTYQLINEKSKLCLGVHAEGPTVELQQYAGDDTQTWTLTPQLAPSTVVPDKQSGSVKFPLNKWVDVLQMIDTTRDRVNGTWTRSGTELSCASGFASRIELPVDVDGGYDLETEVTRTAGTDLVATLLPVDSHRCMAGLSGWEGSVSGLMNLNGHEAKDSENPIVVRPGSLENGRRYKVLTSVRILKNGRASIDVSLDGKPYLPHWEGDPADLTENGYWAMPHANRPGLGATNSEVTFHSVRLRMVSGSASIATAVVEPAANSDAPTIIKARWGRRKTWVDVTAVVKEAVDKGEVVYANSGFLKVDPTQGKKKQLQITYKVGETEQATNINEGGKWSKDEYGKPAAE